MNEQQPVKTREEIVAAAYQRNEQAKEQRQSEDYNSPSSSREYPQNKYYPIKDKGYTIIHPVGGLMEERRKGFEAKLIMYSEIIDDKGYKFKVNYPYLKDEYNSPKYNEYNQIALDPDYILYKMWNLLREGMTFKEATKTARPNTGKYANTPVYQRVFWNMPDQGSNNFNKPWLGQARVLLPSWIPGDKWGIENNSSQILTTKLNVYKSSRTGKDIEDAQRGITLGLYNKLLSQVAYYNGSSLDTDIVIRKHPNAPPESMYEILRASDPVVRQMVEADTGIKISDQPLDPDFVSKLNHQDLDDPLRFFNVTSNFQIKKHLGQLVKDVDKTVNEFNGNNNSRLFEELSEKAAIEEAEYKKQQTNKTKTVSSVPHQEAPVRESRAPQKKLDTESRCKNLYPFWEKLSSEEKKLHMAGIESWTDSGYPVFTTKSVADYPACGSCKFPDGSQVVTHTQVSLCPYCGKIFTVVEDDIPF